MNWFAVSTLILPNSDTPGVLTGEDNVNEVTNYAYGCQ